MKNIKKLKLTIRPIGIDDGKYGVSHSEIKSNKELIIGGWLGDLLQDYLGNKTHIAKIEITEVS